MAGLFVVVVVVWQPDGAHQQFSIAIIIFFAFLVHDSTSARLAFGKHLIQWHCSVARRVVEGGGWGEGASQRRGVAVGASSFRLMRSPRAAR